MKRTYSVISSGLVGAIFGVLSNYSILVGISWLNLGVWALVGLLIGAFIEETRLVRWSGLSYGFFVTVAFLASGFHGTSDKIAGFTIFSLVLGLVGAFCGLCLLAIGNWIKTKFRMVGRI